MVLRIPQRFLIGSTKELAKRRIRVNTICPAMADTPMGAAYLERMEEGRYPLGKLMPEDIAGAVLFLLSNASKKITGQAIQITAGVRRAWRSSTLRAS
ncbi:SDR family oxidoreductase [Oscillospiraceae bacterium 50-60]